MLAPGIANGIKGFLDVVRFGSGPFPGPVLEVAECLEFGRQVFLAFGKRPRMHVQVPGHFGITATPRQNPQVERKQVNPAANLEVASDLLPPGRLYQPLQETKRTAAWRRLRTSQFLAAVGPPAMRASLTPERVGLYRRDQCAGKAPIGIPGNAGERQTF